VLCYFHLQELNGKMETLLGSGAAAQEKEESGGTYANKQ